MTAEQFLQNLDLSDDLIRESDPADFCRNASRRLRQILTFGGLAAAIVLCFTVGLTRFFSPTPGGSPSVQLPPVVATDTQTATTDTNSSTNEITEPTHGCPPPHFHYQGALYSENGRLVVENALPEGFSCIGELVFCYDCVIGLNCDIRDLYGSVEGVLYLNDAQTVAYIECIDNKSGKTVYRRMEISKTVD